MKTKRKIRPKHLMSMLLVLMMVLTLLPVTAFAADTLLDAPTNIRWEGTVAKWDVVAYADHYTVSLYKNDKLVNSIIPFGYMTSYDMSDKMQAGGKGIYTFKVQAFPDSTDTTHTSSISSELSAGYSYGVVVGPLTFEDSSSYDIPAGRVSTVYTSTTPLTATGGTGEYTFKIETPVTGLKINTARQLVYNRPATAASASTATITVTDSAGTTKTIVIDIGEVTASSVPEYTVHFDVNGGDGTVADQTTSSQKLMSLPAAFRSGGYSLDGWYTKSNGGTKITTSTVFSAETTVYAKWTARTDATDTPHSDMPFKDVSDGAYYRDAVVWAVDEGITSGTYSNHFSPEGICTRAQAVTFLWRASGSPAPATTSMRFRDVSADSYYYNAVLWAVDKGVVNGTSSSTFSPDMNCSRAQIVTMLWRADGSNAAAASNPFADVNGSDYYADAVLWAVGRKVTEGTSSKTFSPDNNCTRAQIVTFIYRMK